MADQPIPSLKPSDAELSVAPVTKPKAIRRSPRLVARKPKAVPVAQTIPLAAVSPAVLPPPIAARPPLPKLLPAGHHGPDATMMYFLSLMLLLIIFFSTLVVVQQVRGTAAAAS